MALSSRSGAASCLTAIFRLPLLLPLQHGYVTIRDVIWAETLKATLIGRRVARTLPHNTTVRARSYPKHFQLEETRTYVSTGNENVPKIIINDTILFS